MNDDWVPEWDRPRRTPNRMVAKARERRPPSRFAGLGQWALVLVGVLVVVVLITVGVHSFYGRKHVETVVTSKERVCGSGNSDCKYLVFTENGTYKVTDSLLIGRVNSSDAYGKIKVCDRYRLTYYGWRIGLFSKYPNIEKAESLGHADGCTP